MTEFITAFTNIDYINEFKKHDIICERMAFKSQSNKSYKKNRTLSKRFKRARTRRF